MRSAKWAHRGVKVQVLSDGRRPQARCGLLKPAQRHNGANLNRYALLRFMSLSTALQSK